MAKTTPQKVPIWTYDDPAPTPPYVRECFTIEKVSDTLVITCRQCKWEQAATVPFTLVCEHALRHRYPPALPVAPVKQKGRFPG